jgi:hypothetical protein
LCFYVLNDIVFLIFVSFEQWRIFVTLCCILCRNSNTLLNSFMKNFSSHVQTELFIWETNNE